MRSPTARMRFYSRERMRMFARYDNGCQCGAKESDFTQAAVTFASFYTLAPEFEAVAPALSCYVCCDNAGFSVASTYELVRELAGSRMYIIKRPFRAMTASGSSGAAEAAAPDAAESDSFFLDPGGALAAVEGFLTKLGEKWRRSDVSTRKSVDHGLSAVVSGLIKVSNNR